MGNPLIPSPFLYGQHTSFQKVVAWMGRVGSQRPVWGREAILAQRRMHPSGSGGLRGFVIRVSRPPLVAKELKR